VFLIVYDNDGIISDNLTKNNMIISDNYFDEWSKKILINEIPFIDKNTTLYFTGYYQHDNIYLYFKNKIIDYILNKPELNLITDRNDKYKAQELFKNDLCICYDIVIHLRLEDFIDYDFVMSPLSLIIPIDNIVKENLNKSLCFVLNTPKTDLEYDYINFFKKRYSNIVVEHNDVMTDFKIMRNAKILVCSCSTLSWCAAFLSTSIKQVYFPNYETSIHQTFKKPILNTILYDYIKCSKKELYTLLQKK
jgi:hypothetical protein